jgi:hypothetical protein
MPAWAGGARRSSKPTVALRAQPRIGTASTLFAPSTPGWSGSISCGTAAECPAPIPCARLTRPAWIVTLLRWSGLRVSEAVSLRRCDVDFTPGEETIVVRQSKTPAGRRSIPLLPPLLAELRRQGRDRCATDDSVPLLVTATRDPHESELRLASSQAGGVPSWRESRGMYLRQYHDGALADMCEGPSVASTCLGSRRIPCAARSARTC